MCFNVIDFCYESGVVGRSFCPHQINLSEKVTMSHRLNVVGIVMSGPLFRRLGQMSGPFVID